MVDFSRCTRENVSLAINPRVDPSRDHAKWVRSVYDELPRHLKDLALMHRAVKERVEFGRSERKNRNLEWKGDSVVQIAVTYLICELLEDEQIGRRHTMRSAIVCGKSLARGFLSLGITHDVKTWSSEPDENCLENTFEAICGAMMQHCGYERAIEWVKYALIDVVVDAWKLALREGEVLLDQRMAKRKVAEDDPAFGQKKAARRVPDASVLNMMETTPAARIAHAQEKGRLPPEVDPEAAALDHLVSARYFVPSMQSIKDITQRLLRQAGHKLEFRPMPSRILPSGSRSVSSSSTDSAHSTTSWDSASSSASAASMQCDDSADKMIRNHEALYVVPDDPESADPGFLLTIGRGASRREAQFRALVFLWDKFKELERYWLPSAMENLRNWALTTQGDSEAMT